MADDDETEDGQDNGTFIAMTKNRLKALVAKCRTSAKTMEEERGRIGGLIADAVENHHCHKGSLGWIRKLDRMDPAKRDEHLWNFMADLKSMGWDKIPDLFREQPLETSAEPASKPRRGPRVVGGSDAETRQEAAAS